MSDDLDWSPPGTNGWTTFRPAEPCGKPECKPMTFEPSTAPTPRLDVAELEAREDAQRFRQEAPEEYDRWVNSIHATNERLADSDYENSLHEAAHALMVCAVGGKVVHLQLAGQPHCAPSGIATVADSMLLTVSGDIGAPSRRERLSPLVMSGRTFGRRARGRWGHAMRAALPADCGRWHRTLRTTRSSRCGRLSMRRPSGSSNKIAYVRP
jgi:hypothetical protein